MKKKGLIISTVVMVVVLIASLTTATYAWFTASSKTELKGFDVSVVSNNAVNIGMKKTYGFSPNVSETEFCTGSVIYTSGNTDVSGPGVISSPGSWDGTAGLSSTLEHNINWGSQSKAVGVSTETVTDNNFNDVNESNTRFWVTDTVDRGTITYGNSNAGKNTVIAANKGEGGQFATPTKAYANINGESAGDYVHFILGVSPTRNLGHNNFVIMITPTETTSQLGVLASIHVAYRVRTNDAGSDPAWTEVDAYDGSSWQTKTQGYTSNVTGDTLAAYQRTIGNDSASAPKGSRAVVIDGLDIAVNKISQVEVVIYIAGADPDCNDQGKTSAGNIMMFFDTVDAQTQATDASISDGKLTVTGGETTYTSTNTTVQIKNGDTWTTVDGTWENGTFTSKNNVTGTEVRVTTNGKTTKVLTIKP